MTPPSPLPMAHQTESHKILIMGLPGSGKTTLARALAPALNAVYFNADEVRANINRDLKFSPEDRVEHARRMGWLCDRVIEAGHTAVADFICPTPETRAAFGNAFIVFVDRIKVGRFQDTNRLFVPPELYDLRVGSVGMPDYWAKAVIAALNSIPKRRGLVLNDPCSSLLFVRDAEK
jgi:energy-coupling factor transporter ATP-binding protein EcfA2